MQVIGKIKVINETQTFGAKGFRKRELVVTTNEQYPQMLMVEFIQDKCDLLDNFKVDDDVCININLRGKEWVNPEGVAKYFNSIQGWRIEPTIIDDAPSDNLPPKAATSGDEPDDLPF